MYITYPIYLVSINGSFVAYFNHGRRGFQQGGPLSQYLFDIVMEVLSL